MDALVREKIRQAFSFRFVTVDLAGNDSYTVRRVFTRAGRTWVKGERTDIYCDQVGEQAYQASCFRNVDF